MMLSWQGRLGLTKRASKHYVVPLREVSRKNSARQRYPRGVGIESQNQPKPTLRATDRLCPSLSPGANKKIRSKSISDLSLPPKCSCCIWPPTSYLLPSVALSVRALPSLTTLRLTVSPGLSN